jgi:DNA transformation protein and related proteins
LARSPKTPPIPTDLRAVIDRFETRGPVRTKAMFGGHGVWCDDRFVAIVFHGVLYLKVNAATRSLFVAAGCRPFQMSLDRPSRLVFYTLPADAVVGSDALDLWLDRAIVAASR